MKNLADLISKIETGRVYTDRDRPPFKTEAEHIGAELQEQESVADNDMSAANTLKPRLLQAYNVISANIKDIEKTLSGFNSPGLKAAFLDSIKKSIKGNKFDMRAAEKHLFKYYKR